MSKDDRLTRLSWPQILALSAPAFVIAGYQIPLTVFAPAFLAEHVGLSLGSIATIMLLARLWDMINDPIVGFLSDATASRLGRRRPWIILGAPLALLGTWQFYFAAPGTPFGAILFWTILLYTGWTMIVVAHGAWGVEISRDYDERSRIFGFKMLAVAIAAPLFALGPALMERSAHARISEQMGLMGGLVIAGIPLTIAWLLWVTPDSKHSPTRLSWRRLWESYTVVFSRPLFAQISAAYFFAGMADAIGSAAYLFFVRDGLALPNWAATFLVLQTLFGFVSIPLWLWVSKRTDKRRALIGVLVGQLLLAPIPLLLPAASLMHFAAFTAAKGLIWGAEYMLLRAIVSDLVDVDARETGANRAGTFYASFNLTLGLASALGGAAVLWGLSHIGYDPKATADTRTQFSFALRLIASAAPALCALVGIVLISNFRMGRRHTETIEPEAA